MSAARDESRREATARHGTAVVWTGGAVSSALLGFATHPEVAVAALAIAVVATLLVARVSLGWRAVPIVFTLLVAQTPVLFVLGIHTLNTPLKELFFPIYIYDLESLATALVVSLGSALLATPVGWLMSLGPAGVHRLRGATRAVVPTMLVSAMLLTAGAARLSRLPAAASYIEELPVQFVIPAASELPCEALPRPETAHQSHASCATPEIGTAQIRFHHHCESEGGERPCLLVYRLEGGVEREGWWLANDESVSVYRDEFLGSWVVGPSSSPRVVGKSLAWLRASDVAARISAPASWVLVSGAGLAVALASSLTWRALRRFRGRSEHSDWIRRVRGDCAVATVATLVASSALLLAALAKGMLL